VRVAAEKGSFGAWLRGLPLKPGRPAVKLYDGREKGNQEAHVAVVDMDVGTRDLQQCADAVIRLRAEYLFAAGRIGEIAFSFTSGERAAFARWADGWRPRVAGRKVQWVKSAAADRSHASLRKYLDVVFTYAGSLSLAKELRAVEPPSELQRADSGRISRGGAEHAEKSRTRAVDDAARPVGGGNRAPSASARRADVQIGDVFIQGGSPGHAVIVVDVAVEQASVGLGGPEPVGLGGPEPVGRGGPTLRSAGTARPTSVGPQFLLAQSYMPAQEMHVLKNPANADGSPWYAWDDRGELRTPEWTFPAGSLRRFETRDGNLAGVGAR
jgi:hypothetical protein